MRAAAEAGFDGVIVPDVPLEETPEICGAAEGAGLCHVGLIAPTTTADRRERIARSSTGFVYQIAAAGTTGERKGVAADLEQQVAAVRGTTNLPICVGFGISTALHVREVCSVADGAIVGSALVRRIAQGVDAGNKEGAICADVESFLTELFAGLPGTAAR